MKLNLSDGVNGKAAGLSVTGLAAGVANGRGLGRVSGGIAGGFTGLVESNTTGAFSNTIANGLGGAVGGFVGGLYVARMSPVPIRTYAPLAGFALGLASGVAGGFVQDFSLNLLETSFQCR